MFSLKNIKYLMFLALATSSAFVSQSVAFALSADGSINSTVEINDSTVNGPTLSEEDLYGISISGIGDLNDDGVEDIAVGAENRNGTGTNRGAIFIHFMNVDGSIDSTVEINDSTVNGPTLSDNDYYGSKIAGLGDLNDDGVEDIAVGAQGIDEGGTNRGAIFIHFMNVDGSIDSTVEINDSTVNGPELSDNDYYGYSLANIGDLNLDGVIDIAVGATDDDAGGTDRGTLHIHFMNTDGSIDSTVEINDLTVNGPELVDLNYYGASVSGIGDLNVDGVLDIAVGSNNDDSEGTNRGKVFIHFMNTDGSVDNTVEIKSSTTNGPSLIDDDSYGYSIANMGDFNGDGVNDIAVGSFGDDSGGTDRGSVYIHFMNVDGSIDSTVEITDLTTNGPTLSNGDHYGAGLANIGDLNNDGIVDIAVGATRVDIGGTDYGGVFIHFMSETSDNNDTSNDKERCYLEEPPAPTWMRLQTSEIDGVKGMLLTWTQYGADKINIRIDDSSGTYPWKISETSNDGHEFLQNVFSWQNIIIKPINGCNEGEYSTPISLDSYPHGWYGDSGQGDPHVLSATSTNSGAPVPITGSNNIFYLLCSILLIVLGVIYYITGKSRALAIRGFESTIIEKEL